MEPKYRSPDDGARVTEFEANFAGFSRKNGSGTWIPKHDSYL